MPEIGRHHQHSLHYSLLCGPFLEHPDISMRKSWLTITHKSAVQNLFAAKRHGLVQDTRILPSQSRFVEGSNRILPRFDENGVKTYSSGSSVISDLRGIFRTHSIAQHLSLHHHRHFLLTSTQSLSTTLISGINLRTQHHQVAMDMFRNSVTAIVTAIHSTWPSVTDGQFNPAASNSRQMSTISNKSFTSPIN